MTRSRHPAAVAASVMTALSVKSALTMMTAVSLGLVSGCAAFSEQTTDMQYTPSDGAQGDVGDLAVRNLMLVAEDAEGAGSLVGVFLNSGSEDLDVTVSSENGVQAAFDVPAGGSVSVGPDGDETVEVDPVDVVPGRTVPVTVSGGTESLELVTPVLDGSLPDYADLVPSAGTDG